MQLPLYELDSSVYLREDDSVTVAGLYLPDIQMPAPNCCTGVNIFPRLGRGGYERSMSTRLGYKNITGKAGRGQNAIGNVYGGWQTDLSMCRRRDFPTGHAGGVVQLATARSAVCYRPAADSGL